MARLEKSSWIAGIVSAVLAVVGFAWGVWVYLRPPESPQPQATTIASISGDRNVVVQGSNNTINNSISSATPATVDPESLVDKLTTGITRKSLEEVFGQPRFDEFIKELGVRNLVFVFPRFFLQAVVSSADSVIFYSVTTRSTAFRPEVPKLGGRLVETKLAAFGEAEHVYSDMTSKYYEYAEKIYLGNAGNYRTIYLGFCPSGAPPDWGKFEAAVLDRDGPARVNQFRSENAPNCYGVGDIMGDESAVVQGVRMGLDYYVARDLPQ